MRTPLFAAFLGLSLTACTGVIGDPGPGGDDDVPGPDCGDGVVNSGETCDDGNNASGDGCSAACSMETSPALAVTIDKATVMTELMSETMLTVTFSSSGGFAGPVTLTGSAVDGASAPLAAWGITFDKTTVDVPANGTATAVATVKIPSENKGLAGTVKIDAESSLGARSATSAVTVLNQVSMPMTLVSPGAGCTEPALRAITMSIGSKIRWVNKSPEVVRIHVDAGGTGLIHEPEPGTAAGGVHEQTLASAGIANWYCHDRKPENGKTITAR
ncbi:MAG: myxococcus cysteine-rich repeat containing protein [Kofleriaceae bacterium]